MFKCVRCEFVKKGFDCFAKASLKAFNSLEMFKHTVCLCIYGL